MTRALPPVTWLTRLKTSGLHEEADPHAPASSAEWTNAFPVFSRPQKAISESDFLATMDREGMGDIIYANDPEEHCRRFLRALGVEIRKDAP